MWWAEHGWMLSHARNALEEAAWILTLPFIDYPIHKVEEEEDPELDLVFQLPMKQQGQGYMTQETITGMTGDAMAA